MAEDFIQKTGQKTTELSLDLVKDHLIYRLENPSQNPEKLVERPYVPYLDLTVFFYVRLQIPEYGFLTIPVKHHQAKEWGLTAAKLYEQASGNTPKLLPYDFYSLRALLEESYGTKRVTGDSGLYVLTNQEKQFGATSLLYAQRLTRIGQLFGEDFFVLPSSVHEVLLLPNSQAPDRQDLNRIVREVNETQVEEQEVLSNRVYYYDRAMDQLSCL